MIKSLFKRSGKYFFGLATSRAVRFATYILFARKLQPQNYGSFIFFVTLLQIVTVLADGGLNQWYQKQKVNENSQHLFSKIFLTRMLTLIISIFFVAIILILKPTFSPYISILLLVTLIFHAFISITNGYYFEKKQPMWVALKEGSLSLISLSAFFLLQNFIDLKLTIEIFVFSSFFTALWSFPWKEITHLVKMSLSEIIETIKQSSSYALLNLTSFAYARGDSIIVQYTLNSTALGYYGSAYRYLETLALIPTAIQHNLFPLSAKKDRVDFASLIKIMLPMIIIGFIISIVVYFAANFLIVGLLGTNYAPAIIPLRILSLTLFLFFVNAPLATIVQSSDLVGKFLPWGIVNTVGNLLINIIFIPIYGINAAAGAMFFSECTGLIINIYFVKKIYQTT